MSCLDAEVDDERVVLDDLDKDLQSDAPNSQTKKVMHRITHGLEDVKKGF